MEDDHRSGLGRLLPPEWETVYIATSDGDNAMQVARMFNAEHTNEQEFIIQMTRPKDEEYATAFLTCWVHLLFALGKCSYQGTIVEDRLHVEGLMKDVVRFIYYSKTGEERHSLHALASRHGL